MPYSDKELREIADTTEDDPTFLVAPDSPGAADEEGPKYHPVTINGESWVRRRESTLDWQNYQFTLTNPDGTTHSFTFTAKDDEDAQRKVRERVAATQHTDAHMSLVRLDAPKELTLETNKGYTELLDDKESAPQKVTTRANKARTKKADKEAQGEDNKNTEE